MLITIDEVRSILLMDATDTTKDNQISTLIPLVQAYILDECDVRQFMDTRIQITASTLSFAGETILDSESQFIEALFADELEILVENSLYNDGVYTIKEAAAGVLTIDFSELESASFNVEPAGEMITITRIILPLTLKRTAAKMIAFDMNKSIAKGLTSETISKYSASFGSDYPASISRELNSYRSLK